MPSRSFPGCVCPTTASVDGRRILGGLRAKRSPRQNDVHLAINQVLYQFGKSRDITLGPSVFDSDALPFNLVQSPQAFTECSKLEPIGARTAGYEPTYPRNFCRGLRACYDRPD